MWKILVVVLAALNGEQAMPPMHMSDTLNEFKTEEDCKAHLETPEFKARMDQLAEAVAGKFQEMNPYNLQPLQLKIGVGCVDKTPGKDA